MARVAKAAGATGGFLKKMLGDLIRPAKKRLGDAVDTAKTAARKANARIPGGRSVRNADGVRVRDWRGRPIRTEDLRHPHSDLLDHDALRRSARDTTGARDTLAKTPGADASHPTVRDLTKNYDGKTDNKWPDAERHPDGFSTPEDRHPAVLNPGDRIDRFGWGYGQYTSPAGIPYEQRALPPSNITRGYHQYEVVRPLPVWQGGIAPAQGQAGGGVQHYLPYPAVDLIRGGYLREIPL